MWTAVDRALRALHATTDFSTRTKMTLIVAVSASSVTVSTAHWHAHHSPLAHSFECVPMLSDVLDTGDGSGGLDWLNGNFTSGGELEPEPEGVDTGANSLLGAASCMAGSGDGAHPAACFCQHPRAT